MPFAIGDRVRIDMPGSGVHGRTGAITGLDQTRSGDSGHVVDLDGGNFTIVSPQFLCHESSGWTRRNYDYWFGIAFVACHAVAFAFDLWLVFNDHESISSRIWRACDEHPTLIAAGALGSTGVACLVRRYRWMVFFTGVMCGHLFSHS